MEKNKMIYAQESLVDEIIVDNFAGGGGAEITTMAQLTDCVAV